MEVKMNNNHFFGVPANSKIKGGSGKDSKNNYNRNMFESFNVNENLGSNGSRDIEQSKRGKGEVQGDGWRNGGNNISEHVRIS